MRRANPVTTASTTEAVRDRPGVHARLLPTPFPPTVSPGQSLSGDGRSIDYTRHTSMQGHSRVCAPLGAHSSPASGQGLRPDIVEPPEAIALRLYSPVVSLGTPLPHDDGMEDTPDPLRTVESVWGLHPTLDSPVVPLGEPCPTSNGRESALPSLRMVECFPHEDRPRTGLPIALYHRGSGAGRPSGPSALVMDHPSPTPPPPSFPSSRESIPGCGERPTLLNHPNPFPTGGNQHGQRRPPARRRCSQRKPERPETRPVFPTAQAGVRHPRRPSPTLANPRQSQAPSFKALENRPGARRPSARLCIEPRPGRLEIP